MVPKLDFYQKGDYGYPLIFCMSFRFTVQSSKFMVRFRTGVSIKMAKAFNLEL